MKTLIKIICLVLVFGVEVNIKAATGKPKKSQKTKTDNFFSEPTNCLKEQQYPCVFSPKSKNALIDWGPHFLSLMQGTFIEVVSMNEFKLLSGSVMVKTKDSLRFINEYGDAVASHGSFLIERVGLTLSFSNYSASGFKMKMNKHNELIELPIAFKMAIQGLDSTGKPVLDIPQAMGVEKAIRTWGKAYPGPYHEFKNEISAVKSQWLAAAEISEELNKSVLSRQLASLEVARSQELARKQKIEAENRELRALFRRKNNLD